MIKGGPKIINDGLVLCLDAHDAKSYAGEPVTNLVTSTAVDFSIRSTYSGNTFSQVADSESPSGYACEMSYTGTVNSSSRCRFGVSTNIPTSGTGFVSIWAKRSAGTSTMRPKVYTGYAWYHLEPLDGGSIYFTDEYRPFGVAVTFGTNSGGPNPGFSMTHAGGSTENDKTRWIKPQVTTLSYNIPFANLSRSATNGWVDRTTNNNDGTLVNGVNTGVSHYRDGQVIMPVANSYLDFDGSNDYVDLGNLGLGSGSFTVEAVIYPTLASTYHVFFRKGDDSTSNDNMDWSMGYDYDQFHVRAQNASVAVNEYAGGSFINNYGHVALTYNGSTIRMYLNGSQVSSKNVTLANNYSNYSIGRGINNYADLKVSMIRVYNQTLTAAEVLDNYNSTKSKFS